MSASPSEKYIIGLTGKIATGKSVVRKMLEHLGAYSIDADALSHRAIAKGSPGYQPIINTFGTWILRPDGEIDRPRLGRIAFGDPSAMALLEGIIHPLVSQATGAMIKRSTQRVIVIEAIKLLEGSLRSQCNAIWVVNVPREVQINRLVEKRGLTRAEALQRIDFQGGPESMLQAANVIIQNDGSYEETWKQVQTHWKKIALPASPPPEAPTPLRGEFSVIRGRPRDSAAIAQLINRLSNGQQSMTSSDVMAAFGEKAYMLLQINGKNVGIAGWQVENLVARTTEFFIDPAVELEKGLKTLINEVERASTDLQCEASILLLPPSLASRKDTWEQLGYQPRTAQDLQVRAWVEAANESARPNTQLFFRQLRQDRVLRPI